MRDVNWIELLAIEYALDAGWSHGMRNHCRCGLANGDAVERTLKYELESGRWTRQFE